MSPKREQREHVNTKWLIRKLYVRDLPYELREMLLALYCHSSTFVEAETVRNGLLEFSAQASQRQLADFCHLSTEKSAYSRLVRLHRLGLVDWTANHSHKSNEYFVSLSTAGVKTTGEPDEDEFLPSTRTALSSVVQEASSVVSDLSPVVETLSSVVKTTDSVLPAPRSELPFCLSAIAETGEQEDTDQKPNLRGFAPEPPPKGLLVPGPHGMCVPPEVPHSAPPPTAFELQKREADAEQQREMRTQHRWQDDKPTSRCRRCSATLQGYYDGTDPQECPGAAA